MTVVLTSRNPQHGVVEIRIALRVGGDRGHVVQPC